MNAETEYRNAIAELETAQRALGATPRSDVDARAAATRVVEASMDRVRELKEEVKRESTRKNFAGLGNTPLYIACAEQLDPATIAALEARALEIQIGREQAAAARRAAREPAPELSKSTPKEGRKPAPAPEIIVRRPRAAGSTP